MSDIHTDKSTNSKLLALAERVEAASGPDRELCAQVAEAVGWRRHPDTNRRLLIRPDGAETRQPPPDYLASLDAAMTLVPEGWSVGIGHLPGVAWKVRAHLRDHRAQSLTKEGYSHIYVEGHHLSFAFALTAAALRARAAISPARQG